MTAEPSHPATPRRLHWDERYSTVGADEVSWHEVGPAMSLTMLDLAGVGPASSVIDVGGGAARLVDTLLSRGFPDVTVLDVSAVALAEARSRVGDRATWIRADLLDWEPPRRWAVWHDRAVFHFLTEPDQRATYRRLLRAAVEPGGIVVVGTFAADGPESCSGLPVRGYDPVELIAEFDADFDVIADRRAVHRTPRGAVQPFTWLALRAPRC